MVTLISSSMTESLCTFIGFFKPGLWVVYGSKPEIAATLGFEIPLFIPVMVWGMLTSSPVSMFGMTSVVDGV